VQSPNYEVSELGQVPYIDAAGTFNSQDGKTSLFILNRDLSNAHQVEITWEDKEPGQVVTSFILTGDDLKASNTFDAPARVRQQTWEKPSTANGRTMIEVPARSYTLLQWGV
jgi:alpha-N-arabinofuranosidase